MTDHDEIRGLLGAFAIDAVDEAERRTIEDHLASCSSCRAELDVLVDVADQLALATAVDLPDGFVDRVVADAVGDRAPARIGQSWTRWWVAIGAVATAAVIAVAGIVVESRNDAERERRVLALLAEDQGILLHGNETGVIGRVVPTDGGSELAIAGVDSAPEGSTYQLWLMRGSGCPTDPSNCELISGGTFNTEDGSAVVDVDEDVDDWDDAAVSVEDEGGAEAPTTDPFIHSF